MDFRKAVPLMGATLLLAANLVSAKDETPPVKTIKVTDNIHMLMGKGWNMHNRYSFTINMQCY